MIAKLERVPLRDAFPSEVKDLSQWVRANIEELNAATGLSLSNASADHIQNRASRSMNQNAATVPTP